MGKVKNIVTVLEEWGCTDVEFVGDMVHFTDSDSYESSIPLDELNLADKVETFKNTTRFSCCGTELDEYHMISSVCCEHC